jgi:hypothetical protein
MARPNFRKKNGRDTWHFCTNCSNWLTSDYDIKSSKPNSDELCNECLSKEKRKVCQ